MRVCRHRRTLRAPRASPDQHTGIAGKPDTADLTGRSHCDDWNLAQVPSHLGSSAEISRTTLRSARGAIHRLAAHQQCPTALRDYRQRAANRPAARACC
jgi:hypothetical protein